MLHRAIVGSLERFIGILIENHAGALPLWLAPVQAVAMNVTEHQGAYVSEVVDALKVAGIRVHADLRNEKISYKIREHSLQKLPFQLVIGDKEVASQLVAVRSRKGEDLGQMPLDAFLSLLKGEIMKKGRAV
jgi:threonyl-tRNA synthetase